MRIIPAPSNPQHLTVIAGVISVASIAVGAVAVLAARKARRTTPTTTELDVTDAVDQALRETVGARLWAAVYTTIDGEYAIHAPYQDPLIAAQQLADGVHGLTCPGCERCQLEVA